MSAINQICFTDETNCSKYNGHPLKPNICTNCNKEISKHNANIVSEEDLIKALESTQKGERIPSLILENDHEKGYGQLFLGGFKGAVNEEFIKEKNLGGILNTAGNGLFKLYGKKIEKRYKDLVSSHKLSCLYLRWKDSLDYDIPDEDIEKAVKHIHEVRKTGASILVHCAQGKSRSTTAVVAYIMSIFNMTYEESLAFVKEKRKMAEPNIHFAYLLHEFEKSDLLRRLRDELQSNQSTEDTHASQKECQL